MEQAFIQQLAERKKARQAYPVFNPGDPQQAYFRHYEDIRSHLTVEDFSRVDAMIALRMRANAFPECGAFCHQGVRSNNKDR